MLFFQYLGGIAIAAKWDGGAAEVKRSTISTDHHFHTRSRLDLFQRFHGRSQCCHLGIGAINQCLNQYVDIGWINLGFVTLNIDENLAIGTASPRNLGDPIRSTRMFAGEFCLATKISHGF